MSQCSPVEVTYTARGLKQFQVTVRHNEMNEHKVIRSDDPDDVLAKAKAQMAKWDATWERRSAAADKKSHQEQQKAYAAELTESALAQRAEMKAILIVDLHRAPPSWHERYPTAKFSGRKPMPPSIPPKPQPPAIPPKPRQRDAAFQPSISFIDKVFVDRGKRKRIEARQSFITALQEWEKVVASTEQLYQHQLVERESRVSESQRAYEAAAASFEKERDQFNRNQEAERASLSEREAAYEAFDPSAVEDWCDHVLMSWPTPEWLDASWDIEFRLEAQTLLVDIRIPGVDDLHWRPEAKYVVSRDELSNKPIPKAERNKLFDGLVYQLSLRALHELFQADIVDALKSIVLNTWVQVIDPASGQEKTVCIASIQTAKEELLAVSLEHVDPKACFKSLKGVGSSKLFALEAIAPILEMSREDRRFTSSYDVIDKMDEGDNLAAMDWEDFEHLVREVFQKEFAEGGGEVKVTQASRDGGIDAVIFDRDPIRGGKIVLQAKRYTNTVDVSSVRDLYGTLLNEGAMKGILITTSDFGPDAYNFVKDKPLTLLSGGHLLHLLQKHGHKARIDIKEAKADRRMGGP